jgi:hypothetical protein
MADDKSRPTPNEGEALEQQLREVRANSLRAGRRGYRWDALGVLLGIVIAVLSFPVKHLFGLDGVFVTAGVACLVALVCIGVGSRYMLEFVKLYNRQLALERRLDPRRHAPSAGRMAVIYGVVAVAIGLVLWASIRGGL